MTLADLIGMKLRSGSTNLLRAQDLADVIGLMRHHRLTSSFAPSRQRLRPAFRKLARMIQQERPDSECRRFYLNLCSTNVQAASAS